jgi:hypothetical protein
MHDTLFAESLRPRRHQCLFLPLQTYALGHETELWRAQNPLPIKSHDEFAALPEKDQRAALVEAADICSQTHAEFIESERLLSASPRLTDIRLRWRQQKLLRKWREWKAAINKMQPEDWLLALADFRIYLAAGRAVVPTLNASDKYDAEAYEMANGGEEMPKGRALGSPLLAQIVDFAHARRLMEPFGVKTVWDVPFAGACNWFFAHLETEGSLCIENTRESQVRQEMADHREAVRKENEIARAAWEKCTTDDGRAEAVKAYPRILNLFPDEAVKFVESLN